MGAFSPIELNVPGVQALIDRQIFYRVKNPAQHHGKDVVVLGGGDSALDWTLNLVGTAKSVTLIHRSDKFKAQPASVAKMRELCANGQMKLTVGNVTALRDYIRNFHKKIESRKTQIRRRSDDFYLLACGAKP